jgi:hypothetical protein
MFSVPIESGLGALEAGEEPARRPAGTIEDEGSEDGDINVAPLPSVATLSLQQVTCGLTVMAKHSGVVHLEDRDPAAEEMLAYDEKVAAEVFRSYVMKLLQALQVMHMRISKDMFDQLGDVTNVIKSQAAAGGPGRFKSLREGTSRHEWQAGSAEKPGPQREGQHKVSKHLKIHRSNSMARFRAKSASSINVGHRRSIKKRRKDASALRGVLAKMKELEAAVQSLAESGNFAVEEDDLDFDRDGSEAQYGHFKHSQSMRKVGGKRRRKGN